MKPRFRQSTDRQFYFKVHIHNGEIRIEEGICGLDTGFGRRQVSRFYTEAEIDMIRFLEHETDRFGLKDRYLCSIMIRRRIEQFISKKGW